MTRFNLVWTLVLAGLAGCAAPEQLDGTNADVGTAAAPQVAQSATGAAAAVWSMKPTFPGSSEMHFFQYDGVSWSGPTNLGLGTYPDVALSDSGRAIVVYNGDARVFDGATWGAAQTITPSGVTMPHTHPVTVDALGNGWVAFSASSKAWVVQYGVVSGWKSAKSLSSTATGEWTAIDMSSTGDTVVGFCEASTRLVAAFRSGTGSVWSKKTVGTNCCHSSGGGLGPTSFPIQVSVSETGDAMVIGSNASTQVCAARWDHVTGWGSKKILQSGGAAEFPQVAMNASGDAITAWKVGTQLYLRRYVLGTGWWATATGPNNLSHGGLGVGINDDDDDVAAVVFTSGGGVYYVFQDSAGTVSAPVTISSLPGQPYYLDTASTPLGLGLIGWNQGENLWVARHPE